MTEFEREYELLSELLLNEQIKDRVNDILDKIKAEISAILTNSYDEGVKKKALQIIDKYKGDKQ